MELIKPKITDYPGRHIELTVDKPELDFEEAKDLAKQKAKEFCKDPMLLSWYKGKTGESYPNLECGPGDKPAWIIFADSRGGDLTIDVNAGQFVFIYLSL
ncbi:MAG: AF1514 family protein [Desulfobacterales bacterium]|nr:AF1514 family protein [Desulfobacterales bacterium]